MQKRVFYYVRTHLWKGILKNNKIKNKIDIIAENRVKYLEIKTERKFHKQKHKAKLCVMIWVLGLVFYFLYVLISDFSTAHLLLLEEY